MLLGALLVVAATSVALVYAQDGSDRTVRLAYVGIVSEASVTPAYSVDFYRRLGELGWVRGKNLIVEERWADGHPERMPSLMIDVLRHRVDIIVTSTEIGAAAARNATHEIPIVGVAFGDPIANGLVESLARPGGNVTGLSLQSAEGVPGKCLELIRESLHSASRIAILWNPDLPFHRIQASEIEKVAIKTGVSLQMVAIHSQRDFGPAFQQARKQGQGAILLADPLTYSHRREVTALAAQYHVPTIYTVLDYVPDGGLMAYAGDLGAMYRRAAEYVDKILRGSKAGEIPIEQSIQLKFVINLKAAAALGLTLPEAVLLRADEVIR